MKFPAILLSVSLLLLACQTAPTHTADHTKVNNSAKPFALEEITIADLQQGYANGTYTIASITEQFINRITEIDKNGIQLNSVITINPDAIRIAKALDQELKEGKVRGPMHGIPVLLKDNIDTHDKMPTTAGSLSLIHI